MNKSEKNFERILHNSGITPRYESGPNNKLAADFDFDLGESTIYAEVKELQHNKVDERICSRQQRSWFGAREGKASVTRSGKSRQTGLGGHVIKAMEQLEKPCLDGHQTLVVIESFSLTGSMDSTDIALFMFGHNYRITDRHMVAFSDQWPKETPPMIAFEGFRNISALAYIRNDKFTVYANPFARVQLDSSAIQGISGCRDVYEFEVWAPFNADWTEWTPGFERLTASIADRWQ